MLWQPVEPYSPPRSPRARPLFASVSEFCVLFLPPLVCVQAILSVLSPRQLAFAFSAGPVLAGIALCAAAGDRLSYRWPFHKERVVGQFGLHVAMGLLMTVVPVYHTAEALLVTKGESVYCQMWGCAAA